MLNTQNTTSNAQFVSTQENVHEKYYNENKDALEARFPLRERNDPLAYILQVFIVFGAAIIIVAALTKKLKLQKSFSDVAGWNVTILCCSLNLIFAYAFGFVAVLNDWWFFFPDLITKQFWQIQKGQMVLGDVLFYPMATVMGHITILLVARLKNPIDIKSIDILSKVFYFILIFTVIVFGIPFGSTVMRGMIYWLYIPFGIAGLLFYKRYSGFELWSVTGLFIICEFAWDVFARIKGIWIFPDDPAHQGLYFKEILLCSIGKYPIIWQPEMTQMAFMSGMICLVFFHLSRFLLNKGDIQKR